ncbi:hypothetical protein GCM10023310_70940 [Paenibacillus vulneris]|uniref:EF-hand domain-containing protein n=1 Tax=Paenibacillus vulneris TaxID=1133364 RepID=A0ABW3UEX6_9BACL
MPYLIFRGENQETIEVSELNPLPVKFLDSGNSGSSGDMLKSVYDVNDNGKIDLAEVAETVPWAGITGKPTTFTPATHTHSIADVTNLQSTLNSKAAAVHTHSITDVNGLQTALEGKLTASKMVSQTDSTAEDIAGLVLDFNALLQKLRNAGLMNQ